MNALHVNSGYAFARNPIIFRKDFPSEAQDHRGGPFTVAMDGSIIYTGRFFPPLSLDVSEIADAYVSPLREPDMTGARTIIEIEDEDELRCRNMCVKVEYDSHEDEGSLIVLPGGVSNQNFRRLADLGTDIFTERFFNHRSNFFLTTRTSGWRIVMKETEVYPLYFVLPDGIGDIILKDANTGLIIDSAGYDAGVFALDIDYTRWLAFERFGRLTNIIDVYTDSGFACRVVVERAELSKERRRVKFRNSLGVFEIIELTGEVSITSKYAGADDIQFKRYDWNTGLSNTDRERVACDKVITVKTGIKRPEEVQFLMDMLASEEVYILDHAPVPVKVIPSIEEMEYVPRSKTPQSFIINLMLAETETNIMQDIADGDEWVKPRVFNEKFNNTFN